MLQFIEQRYHPLLLAPLAGINMVGDEFTETIDDGRLRYVLIKPRTDLLRQASPFDSCVDVVDLISNIPFLRTQNFH